MNCRKKLRIIMAALLLCIATTGTNPLHAATTGEESQQAQLNSTLQGTYAFTAWRSCVQTPYAPGFDRTTHALLTDGESMSFVEAGTVRLNGNGSLKIVNARVTQISNGTPSATTTPVVAGLRSSCTGTYAVRPDRSCSIDMTCSAQLPGNMLMTMKPFHYDGAIDTLNKTLTFSESDGGIQTITLLLNGSPINTSERICASSGTMIQTAGK